MEELKKQIKEAIEKAEDKIGAINDLRNFLSNISPIKQPIDNIQWVDVDKVEPNNYNPNTVASREMRLLYISIKEDGYTQPVVTYYDKKRNKYVIVDGFHRYYVCKTMDDIREQNKGRLPIVVIDKDIKDRMASTVRHNRARGKHTITGMSNLVYNMLREGYSDAEICNKLGMEPDELIKLKHITGFSKLFKNHKYSKAYKTKKMIQLEKEYFEGDII